jgi:hypothetical protein
MADQVMWAHCNVFGGENGDEPTTLSRGDFLPKGLDDVQVGRLRIIGAVQTVDYGPEPETEPAADPAAGSGPAPAVPGLSDSVGVWREYAANPRVDGHVSEADAAGMSKSELVNRFRT